MLTIKWGVGFLGWSGETLDCHVVVVEEDDDLDSDFFVVEFMRAQFVNEHRTDNDLPSLKIDDNWWWGWWDLEISVNLAHLIWLFSLVVIVLRIFITYKNEVMQNYIGMRLKMRVRFFIFILKQSNNKKGTLKDMRTRRG